jgi:hypothetical protein
MAEPLFEFSKEFEKVLSAIHEYLSFSLKIYRGHEFYTRDTAWSDNKHFPQLPLSWLEHRSFRKNKPTYREEQSEFFEK